MLTTDTLAAKPFVKWAGGKGSLLPQLKKYLPSKFDVYFEPFVGGGAFFFDIDQMHKAHISDINAVLINAYIDIQKSVDLIIRELKDLELDYLTLEEGERHEFFYKIRKEFNNSGPGVRKTILFLFLNKTCFNGLYRENSKGEFNVPIGSYHNPTICNEKNLQAISKRLRDTIITASKYTEIVEKAKAGDFIYFDPPYHPLSETSSFTAYYKDGFTCDDQVELRDLFVLLHKRGCFVMLSNSKVKFIEDLYADFRQETVFAGRNINARASKRGKIAELLILNY